MTWGVPGASPRGWRVIACDLDGTLIGRDHKTTERDLAALRQARQAGLHVAICTGRNSAESAGIIAALDLSGPGVFVNGATLCDMATGRSVRCDFMDRRIVDEVVDFFGGQGHAVLALADDPETHTPVYIRTEHGPVHRATVEWLIANRMNALVQEEIEPRYRDRIVRLGIVVDVPEALPMERDLTARFGEAITSHSIYAAVYECQVIEAFKAGVTKWSGLGHLCAAMGVKDTEVVTVGDDINDLSMLRGAALSFAMGNASPPVKAAAKKETATQQQSGVAAMVEGILAGAW